MMMLTLLQLPSVYHNPSCAWASEGFFPGVDFSKIFLRGCKSGQICFFPLETKKTTFFCWNLQHPGGPRPSPSMPMLLWRICTWCRKNRMWKESLVDKTYRGKTERHP